MTALSLDDDDRQALLGVVEAFAASELLPLAAHPEECADGGFLSDALDRLGSIGVLDAADDSGLGLWHAPAEPDFCRLSLGVLETLAGASPGVALLAHLRGLATWLDREAGTTTAHPHVAFTGATAGAARATGASLRAADALTPGAREALHSVWGAPDGRQQRLAFGPPDWTDLWWPAWDPEHGWRLMRTPRADLLVDDVHGLHGLDEMTCQRWRTGSPATTVLGAATVVDAFTAHAYGLLTIALATARRSLDRARAYAGARYQGGALIHRHDAVAQLLSRGEQTVWVTRAAIDRLAVLSPGVDRLHQVWRASAQLLPQLAGAGSGALQVLGGVGYMRDVGAEKDLRDLNTLRRMGGSPEELTLRCAGLDDASGGRA